MAVRAFDRFDPGPRGRGAKEREEQREEIKVRFFHLSFLGSWPPVSWGGSYPKTGVPNQGYKIVVNYSSANFRITGREMDRAARSRRSAETIRRPAAGCSGPYRPPGGRSG